MFTRVEDPATTQPLDQQEIILLFLYTGTDMDESTSATDVQGTHTPVACFDSKNMPILFSTCTSCCLMSLQFYNSLPLHVILQTDIE